MVRLAIATRVIALSSVVALVAGCATIMSRGEDELTIDSIPSGADVYLNAEFLGTTPLKHPFERVTFEAPQITLRKEGYAPQTVTLTRTLAYPALIDFTFVPTLTGWTSLAIDARSGNMVRFAPDSYLIDLQKADGGEDLSWQRHHLTVGFALANHVNLRKDIARGGGDYLDTYYHLAFDPDDTVSYDRFLEAVRSEFAPLMTSDDGLALYRRLGAVTASLRPELQPQAQADR